MTISASTKRQSRYVNDSCSLKITQPVAIHDVLETRSALEKQICHQEAVRKEGGGLFWPSPASTGHLVSRHPIWNSPRGDRRVVAQLGCFWRMSRSERATLQRRHRQLKPAKASRKQLVFGFDCLAFCGDRVPTIRRGGRSKTPPRKHLRRCGTVKPSCICRYGQIIPPDASETIPVRCGLVASHGR